MLPYCPSMDGVGLALSGSSYQQAHGQEESASYDFGHCLALPPEALDVLIGLRPQ
jgi:hypothetical protein